MYEVDRWLLRLLTALLESCPTRILLPSPQATEPQLRTVYEGFGLNDRQIELIARATPKRDYYYYSRLGARLFDLALGPVTQAFVAASPEDQRAMDVLCASPDAWHKLKGRAWRCSGRKRSSRSSIPPPMPGVNNAQMAQDAYVPWQNSLEHLADGRQCAIAIEPELYLRFGESQG